MSCPKSINVHLTVHQSLNPQPLPFVSSHIDIIGQKFGLGGKICTIWLKLQRVSSPPSLPPLGFSPDAL